jgi:hypothetical protein
VKVPLLERERHDGERRRPIKNVPAGPLLTLEDTVEFFKLIVGAGLKPEEKTDLVAFLRAI